MPKHNDDPRKTDSISSMVLTTDQIHALQTEMANQPGLRDLHDVTAIMLGTGIRGSELAAARWSDIDFANGVLRINSPKSPGDRQVYLDDGILAILKARRERESVTDSVLGPKPEMVLIRAKRQFRAVCGAVGIQGASFHTLRTSFAAHMLKRGMPVFALSQLLRHRNVHTTARVYLPRVNGTKIHALQNETPNQPADVAAIMTVAGWQPVPLQGSPVSQLSGHEGGPATSKVYLPKVKRTKTRARKAKKHS